MSEVQQNMLRWSKSVLSCTFDKSDNQDGRPGFALISSTVCSYNMVKYAQSVALRERNIDMGLMHVPYATSTCALKAT